MKILMVGDIVGSGGRRAFEQIAGRMKTSGEIDIIVVNAENSAGGKGLTAKLARELFNAGADAITLGDHAWDQREFISEIESQERITRPLNFAPGCPGKGYTSFDTKAGNVLVVNLVGRAFMQPADCPFRAMDSLLNERKSGDRIIIVDFHAEATSEKIVLGRYLDGRITCFAGTHTHVQTSDETVLPKGTAYITDLGMTGAKDSAIGRDLESVTARFLTGMPAKFKMAENWIALEGAVIDVNETSGRAKSIRRVREYL